MKTSTLRRKRIVLPAIAAIAVLAVGGTIWTATADNDVKGDERNRVASAATSAVGGGEAVDVETSDDLGEAYEVEVRRADGSEIDVTLDENLKVVGKDVDDVDDDRDDRAGDRDNDVDADDVNDTPDADDRVLSATERASAEKAALAAVGGGTVRDVEASDDRGAAYDVEVLDKNNVEWDVDLDVNFKVLNKIADN
ncbi:PepSY domain-containing protein [Nocardioides sp. WS12]|uniref:PepSY domain-containing protein n=1 Tax=Nocardioides sp. WS12 TaxID=2486272 RepID=UPI0015FDE2BA|nr:PepSY domain-containing protein [Nocardioides sp. WS12]